MLGQDEGFELLRDALPLRSRFRLSYGTAKALTNLFTRFAGPVALKYLSFLLIVELAAVWLLDFIHGYSSSTSSEGSTLRASVSLRIVAMCAAVASLLSSLPMWSGCKPVLSASSLRLSSFFVRSLWSFLPTIFTPIIVGNFVPPMRLPR